MELKIGEIQKRTHCYVSTHKIEVNDFKIQILNAWRNFESSAKSLHLSKIKFICLFQN